MASAHGEGGKKMDRTVAESIVCEKTKEGSGASAQKNHAPNLLSVIFLLSDYTAVLFALETVVFLYGKYLSVPASFFSSFVPYVWGPAVFVFFLYLFRCYDKEAFAKRRPDRILAATVCAASVLAAAWLMTSRESDWGLVHFVFLMGLSFSLLLLLRLLSFRSWQRQTFASRTGGINFLAKRIADIILSLFACFLLFPLFILLSIAIFLDSPGPIVFAHERIGRNGRKFLCYKFRTMVPDAESVLQECLQGNPVAREEWEENFKLKHDPRVTRMGRLLRRTSLDELPQFWNVLKGEMSLVGPRPVIEEELPKYGDCIDEYLLVPPGITGIWQVNGRSDTTYCERVAMDSWYVRNWSVWLDLYLLLRTVKVVLGGKGAY